MPEISEVNTTIGPEDPHFIHHSDIPEIKLVGTVFDGTGYGGWKRAMLIALSAKNKLGFIDEIGKSILYSNSAEIAWSELEDRFGQSNGAQLYGTQKNLTDFSQGNDSISTYFTKLKSIWDEIDGMGMNLPCSCNCQCGAKIKQKKFQEDQRIVQFLMGLNDSFAVTDSAALYAGNSKGNYRNNYGRNNNYNSYRNNSNNGGSAYNQRNFSNGFRPPNIGSNTQTNSSNVRGNYQQYPQQYPQQDSQRFSQQDFNNKGKSSVTDVPNANVLFCNYCKKFNHRIENCKHLQNRNRRFAANVFNDQDGFPGAAPEGLNSTSAANSGSTAAGSSGGFSFVPDSSANFAGFNNSISSDGPASSANFAGNSSLSSQSFNVLLNPYFNSWILDTGASDHMCSNKALFSDFRTLDKPYSIYLPNGSVVFIDTVGSVPIISDLCLCDVLYVPCFKFNLLSISKLTKQLNSVVSFTPSLCYLQDYSKRHLVLGRNYNDLYLLTNDTHVVPDVTVNKINSNSVVATENFCAKARQHRLSFSSSTSVSLEPFELINIDLWSPYHTSTYNGYKYFLTIVDDFTRCTWTHLLSCKGNEFVFVKSFINMVATQFDRKVRIIRSDNAFELGTNNITS
ncbi:uncharacterized protein LOC141629108 [Silene latifolia]|uniref:uncharacterized protein LOC141629108 n=1 Tax=Silene latifolia TaxID=37657 RepID=UPI003D77E4B6